MSVDTVFCPKEGAISALDAELAAADGPLYARLYDNAVPYTPDVVVADFNEASFAGYSAVGPITWPAAATNGSGKAESDSPALTWTFTGGSGTAVIYGIILTDPSATKAIRVIPFVPAVVLTPGSPTISRVVQLTDVSEL